MYPTLIRYFYYLYYMKSHKTYKYFVLFDIFYIVFKHFLKIKKVQLKYHRYRSLMKTEQYFRTLIHRKHKVYKNLVLFHLSSMRKKRFFKRVFLKNLPLVKKKRFTKGENKLNLFSSFMIRKGKRRISSIRYKWMKFGPALFQNFLRKENLNIKDLFLKQLPSKIISRGSRKRLYRFFQKRYKRLYDQAKRKNMSSLGINKLFLDFLKKVKKQLIVSMNKYYHFNSRNLISRMLFGVNFYTLKGQYFSFKKITDFYPFLDFFNNRLDFLLMRIFPFFSLGNIRLFANKGYYCLNNQRIYSFSFFIRNYDFLQIPEIKNYYFSNLKIMSLYFYLKILASMSYKDFFQLQKKKIYKIFFSMIKNHRNDFENLEYLHYFDEKRTSVLSQDVDNFQLNIDLLQNSRTFIDYLKNSNNRLIRTMYNNTFVITRHHQSQLMMNYKKLENYNYLYNILYIYNILSYIVYDDKIIISPRIKNQIQNVNRRIYFLVKDFFDIDKENE